MNSSCGRAARLGKPAVAVGEHAVHHALAHAADRAPAGAASAAAWATTRSGRSPRACRGTPASSSVQIAFIASTRSRMRRKRVAGSVPWLRISSRFQPAPTPKIRRPPDSRSTLATSLAVTIGSRSMTRQMPAADLHALGGGGRGGERHEQVVRVPVLLGQLAAAGVRRVAAGPGCACARGRRRTRSRAPPRWRRSGRDPPSSPWRRWRRRSSLARRAAGRRSRSARPAPVRMPCMRSLIIAATPSWSYSTRRSSSAPSSSRAHTLSAGRRRRAGRHCRG